MRQQIEQPRLGYMPPPLATPPCVLITRLLPALNSNPSAPCRLRLDLDVEQILPTNITVQTPDELMGWEPL